MASFGDSILRLFKKVAKQSDQHESADGQPQLDGSEEALLNTPGQQPGGEETLHQGRDYSSEAKIEAESEAEMPVRHQEFLHGNFATPSQTRESKWQKQPVFDRHNIHHDDGNNDPLGESGAEREAAHAISFDRAVTQSRIEEERAEDNIAESIKVFADVVSGDDLKTLDDWTSKTSDTLGPGRSTNATEESFKQVAACPTTSPSTLTWLSTQPSAEIRASVASNHHTPAETLRKLATDGDYNVRLAVAGNKRAADDLLKQLTHDENRLVSGEAYSALSGRERSNIQNSLSGFHKLPQQRVNNPVQTKVPIIGSAPGSQIKPPTGMSMPKYTPPKPSATFSALPPSTPVRPAAAPTTPKIPPASAPPSSPNSSQNASPNASGAASAPVPSELPPNAARINSAPVSPGMLTPRSLPKPTVASPPPSGLPNLPNKDGTSAKSLNADVVARVERNAEQSKIEARADAKAELQTSAPATPDGHNLLTNHKFKTT
ncbi:MAG: hypothetical protein KGS72_21280, partial [Cyanobacteria bacterium REEB67]|nr:hypothetical protein [Cyanobacteria bacterium REEB67]